MQKRISGRGIAPVISTLIIVSITISISMSTAIWMRGMGSTFIGFEKIACTSATTSYDYPSRMWTITLVVRNIGTKSATINQIFVNEQEAGLGVVLPEPGNAGTSITDSGLQINQGATSEIKIFIKQGGSNQPFSSIVSCTTILVKFVTNEGYEYIKICELSPPTTS